MGARRPLRFCLSPPTDTETPGSHRDCRRSLVTTLVQGPASLPGRLCTFQREADSLQVNAQREKRGEIAFLVVNSGAKPLLSCLSVLSLDLLPCLVLPCLTAGGCWASGSALEAVGLLLFSGRCRGECAGDTSESGALLIGRLLTHGCILEHGPAPNTSLSLCGLC